MTGAEFLAYVKRTFKRTDKDTEIYEATADVIADIRLQLKTEDYKTESTAVGITSLGEYRIQLPTNFRHLIGQVTLIDDSSGFTIDLKKISKQEYDNLYGDRLHSSFSNVNDSVPVHFCVYSKQIFIGPVPDLITYKYHISYATEDYAAITSSTDPVPFSEKYRVMLRNGVLAEVFAGVESFDEANYWRQLYVDGLLKLKANEDNNISDNQSVYYHGI